MNFLFIHGNYPAQFRHLAHRIGQNKEHKVIFLTARNDAEKDPIEGVEIRHFSVHRNSNPQTHHYLKATEEAVLQGQSVVREIANLMEKGFIPRVVVTHGGMGLGLFIKDLLPKTLHIGYFEWYFRSETTKNLLRDFDYDTRFKTGLRNLATLQELEYCDVGVVPTEWQKTQFPKSFHGKLNVIFDGIDTSFFHPPIDQRIIEEELITIKNRETGEKFRIESNKKILSYATRGMEPLRGFPEFMRSLPLLLKEDPTLEVFIAGSDRRAYSYDSPTSNGSWKDYLLEELGEFEGRNRIHFTGLLSYIDYRNLLWRTNLHCYFTRPYVTSWSLFEAATCGARLAISKSEATKNIVEEESAVWIELDNQESLNQTLEKALNRSNAVHSKVIPGYELPKSLKKWEELINQAFRSQN